MNMKMKKIKNPSFELFDIAMALAEAYSHEFGHESYHLSLKSEGVADLMRMWHSETDQNERNEIIADIQDLIDDENNEEKNRHDYINFSDLDRISKNIREVKDRLLEETNLQGGIKRLSELSGIPQPSLSRFFNGNAMPQRMTLLKIKKALNLAKIELNR